MSFNIDLWNGYDIIKSSFSLNHKRVKQLLDILFSYSSVQKEYYKSLDNLYKEIKESKDFQKSNSLLDDSISLLISSFKVESEKIKNHYNFINKNITEIKEKLDKIKIQIAPYFTENLQIKDSFNKVLNNLILKQEVYNKSCKDLSYFLSEEFAHKIIEEKKSNKNNKIINKEIEKGKEINEGKNIKDCKNSYKEIIAKNFLNYVKNISNKKEKDNLTKKLIENKKDYIKCLIESDKERKKYNKTNEDLLINLQKNYKSLIYLFQNTIHNYIRDKINNYNDLIEINNSNDINVYSKINYKTETHDFITKNATKEFPMNKLEFIPYKINNNKLRQKLSKYNELTKEEQNLIINEINKNFINSKINKHENKYVRESFINKNFPEKLKMVNKLRRSGSSDMLKLKNNIGNNTNIIDNSNNSNNNNIKVNKDDIILKEENEKKSNFIFIKDFVFKLMNNKTQDENENENNILYEMYSDNSLEEKADENENTENYIYNELLFSFMDLISLNNKEHNEYIDYFIKILGYHRAKGHFILNETTYTTLISIFNFILVNYKTSNNVIKNIILFSQTFYRLDNKNKIYILNGLKNHSIFNNTETWHRAINYNLSLSIKHNNYSLNIPNKEEYLSFLNKIVKNTIISYLYDLKLSTSEINIYEEVKKFYITIYELDEKIIEEQVKILYGETTNNNEDKNKDKKEQKNNGIKKD